MAPNCFGRLSRMLAATSRANIDKLNPNRHSRGSHKRMGAVLKRPARSDIGIFHDDYIGAGLAIGMRRVEIRRRALLRRSRRSNIPGLCAALPSCRPPTQPCSSGYCRFFHRHPRISTSRPEAGPIQVLRKRARQPEADRSRSRPSRANPSLTSAQTQRTCRGNRVRVMSWKQSIASGDRRKLSPLRFIYIFHRHRTEKLA